MATYGLTETCGGIAYDGVPLAGIEVRLGAEGAIEVRGPTVMEGYRHDPRGDRPRRSRSTGGSAPATSARSMTTADSPVHGRPTT